MYIKHILKFIRLRLAFGKLLFLIYIIAIHGYLRLRTHVTNNWEDDKFLCFSESERCSEQQKYQSSWGNEVMPPICLRAVGFAHEETCFDVLSESFDCTLQVWQIYQNTFNTIYPESTLQISFKFDILILFMCGICLLLSLLIEIKCISFTHSQSFSSRYTLIQIIQVNTGVGVIVFALMISSSLYFNQMAIETCPSDSVEFCEELFFCNSQVRSILQSDNVLLTNYSIFESINAVVYLALVIYCFYFPSPHLRLTEDGSAEDDSRSYDNRIGAAYHNTSHMQRGRAQVIPANRSIEVEESEEDGNDDFIYTTIFVRGPSSANTTNSNSNPNNRRRLSRCKIPFTTLTKDWIWYRNNILQVEENQRDALPCMNVTVERDGGSPNCNFNGYGYGYGPTKGPISAVSTAPGGSFGNWTESKENGSGRISEECAVCLEMMSINANISAVQEWVQIQASEMGDAGGGASVGGANGDRKKSRRYYSRLKRRDGHCTKVVPTIMHDWETASQDFTLSSSAGNKSLQHAINCENDTCTSLSPPKSKKDISKDWIAGLSCGHIFHSTCIFQWLNGHLTCPTCRSSLVMENDVNSSDLIEMKVDTE